MTFTSQYMKSIVIIASAAGLMLVGSLTAAETAAPVPASVPAAATPAPAAKPRPGRTAHEDEIDAIVQKIRQKMQEERKRPTAEAYAELLAEFDALAAKYASVDPETAAMALYAKGGFISQAIGDKTGADAIFATIKERYPDSRALQRIAKDAERAKAREATDKVKAELVGKPAPALEFKWSTQEGLKSLANLKGKVVVLDFWATWCGPCISSFPNVRKLVEHYQGCDVVVLGVTSIQGRISNLEESPIDCRGDEAKELGLLAEFSKKKDMTWPTVVSVQEVFNKDYGVTGIPHMAIIAPDGTVRVNGIHPAMPLEEKTKKIDAILKEFSLKLPATQG